MNNITIHIGSPKTGCSAMQEIFFPAIKSLQVIRGWDSYRKMVSKNFDQAVLITDEGLAGDINSGSYFESFKKNMLALKCIHGDPAIIFGIRNQSKWVYSLYKQMLHQGEYYEFEKLYNLDNTGILKHDDIFWMPRIEFLKNNFSNVFVYSQETLLSRPQDFFNYFADFLKMEEVLDFSSLSNSRSNEGVSTEKQFRVIKRLNHISSNLSNINRHLSFYNVPMRLMRLTPRHIAQNYIQDKKGSKLVMDPKVKTFMENYYNEDWQKSQDYISF